MPARRSPTLVALALVLLAGCSAPEPPLDEVRAATEKYNDVALALADGYVRDPIDACETPSHMGIVQDLGVMGIHYFRPDLLGVEEGETRLDVSGTHTDFLAPAILLYEPQADSSLALVAVANHVSAAAWALAGNDTPPMFGPVPFELHPADPGMMTTARYELHVWVHRDNPSGVFAPYNPGVTCEHHAYNMPMMMPPDMPPGMQHH
ncbi:MAG: hypothetical protein WEB90_05250 [Gemmatimonadota bacterium]